MSLLSFALLLSACDGGTAPAPVPAEFSQGATSAPEPDGSMPGQIDPQPVAAETAEIISRESISVQGKPACLLTVRYPGVVEQEVTWTGEGCDTVSSAIVTPAVLAEGGQLADLPDEARRDMERMTGGLLVVEGEFTASAYPLNVAGRIYQVPYAD